MLTEGAMLLALAQLLSYLRLYHFPQGGSVDAAMLPVVVFAVRYGAGWGTLAGFCFGLLQYAVGLSTAIDWTTLIADYLLAYTLLGLGAGLCSRAREPLLAGTLAGGAARFLTHFCVGALVWGRYMPEEFLGMSMTSPWLYSFLYNAPYMLLSVLLVLLLGVLLRKPMQKYFRRQMQKN